MSIETEKIKLKVTEIQRFCMHDGPGVRTTVFLKGCPLRCAWCHNPETQKREAELLYYVGKCIGCGACASVCSEGVHLVGKNHTLDRAKCIKCGVCAENCPTGALELCGGEMSIDEVLAVVEKDKAFYGDNGGITVSGGEPFMQANALWELLKECKKRGISTAVETCGYANVEAILAAVPYVDLFLWDVKDTDTDRHTVYTGVSNRKILDNLYAANEAGARVRLRCILVNGVNTCIDHYKNVAEIAERINNLDGVELIPYHAYGGTKSTLLGFEDSGRVEWIPTDAQIEAAKGVLKKYLL